MPIIQVILTLAYPPLIYLGLKTVEPRIVGLCVLGFVGLRLLIAAPGRLIEYTRAFWLPVLAVAGVAVATAAWNRPFVLLLGPVFINLALLTVFAGSLSSDESIVEKIAKARTPDLPKPELAYCRSVTQLWCGFFLLNGSVSLALALYGSLPLWTVYTGAISYVLAGVLFAGEYVYRHWRFRRYIGAATDPLLKLIFRPLEEFERARDGLDPQLLYERVGSLELQQELQVPETLDVWPGHFPEYAIVPGVLQLHWVMDRIGRLRGGGVDLLKIEGLKFKRPLLSGQKFQLKVEETASDRYRFLVADGENVFSRGIVVVSLVGDSP